MYFISEGVLVLRHCSYATLEFRAGIYNVEKVKVVVLLEICRIKINCSDVFTHVIVWCFCSVSLSESSIMRKVPVLAQADKSPYKQEINDQNDRMLEMIKMIE